MLGADDRQVELTQGPGDVEAPCQVVIRGVTYDVSNFLEELARMAFDLAL